MQILFYIMIVFIFMYLSTFKLSKKKFATVNIICGLPGSGKSTCAAYITKSFRSRKNKFIKRVYSNVPIIGAYPYSFKNDFGKYDMSDAVIILDEAGLEANNRDFKNFKYHQLEYLKLLRHRNNILFVFSQTWDDMDLKIRSMAGMIWICKLSRIKFVTKLIPVWRQISVDEDDKQMKDIYYLDHPIKRFFTTKRFFRPFYYKMFDSYDAPELPDYPSDRTPYTINDVNKYLDDLDYIIDKINQGERMIDNINASSDIINYPGAAVAGEADNKSFKDKLKNFDKKS